MSDPDGDPNGDGDRDAVDRRERDGREIRELATDAERREAVEVLQQLWTDRSREAVRAWLGEDDYRAFGAFVEDELVGMAGVRVEDVLHHTTHAWLYDLVVDEPHRGEGHGSALVAFVEAWAADRDCEAVALASPLGKTDVHDYYERRGYERWGYVVEKGL